jgi:4-amino-4-deoxy-L-arabinose transferase-like glycosyltransferase
MALARTPNQALIVLALLALSGLLFFLGLGDMGLTDRDEGRNAEAGREMFETGDRLTPTFNYELRVAKPVFLYWLMDWSYRLFGVSEFAARFPSAFFGVCLIVLQYCFLAYVRDRAVALFGALMLLLNIEILGLGRMALTDSVLIFFTTASLYGFWLGLHGEGPVRRWIWVFYIGMTIATLTKGPVGFVVPLVAAALYLTWTRRWRDYWRNGVPLAGTLVFLLLTLPWYVAMFLVHGDAYASGAKAHTIGRFLSPMEGHSFTIFFYLPVLFLGFFPWSGFLPITLYRTIKDWYQLRRSAFQPDPARTSELELFAALWVIGVFVFFTASSTRLPHYIGPLFPAAAILTACFWSRCLTDPTTPGIRASIHLTTGLGYLLAIGFASLPTLYAKFSSKMIKEFPLAGQIDLGTTPYVIATVLLIGMAFVSYLGLNDTRRGGAFWAAGASFAVMILIVIVVAIPGLNQYFIAPPQVLAYTAGVNLGPSDRLIAYGMTRPSTAFYAKRKVIYVSDNEETTMRTSLAQPGRTMILLPESFLSSLPAEARAYQPILKRFGYVLLANEAMVRIPEGTTSPTPPPIPGHGR